MTWVTGLRQYLKYHPWRSTSEKKLRDFTEGVWEKSHLHNSEMASVARLGEKLVVRNPICCNDLHSYFGQSILSHK